MDYKERFKEAQECIANRQYQEAVNVYQEVMKETEGQDTYYWALKQLGDVVGYIGFKDYFQSIDIYQKIVMEYENEEDNLYDLCQMDMARAYLEMGLEMMDNFDTTIEMIQSSTDSMQEYKMNLVRRRNDYIEGKAEILYKARM